MPCELISIGNEPSSSLHRLIFCFYHIIGCVYSSSHSRLLREAVSSINSIKLYTYFRMCLTVYRRCYIKLIAQFFSVRQWLLTVKRGMFFLPWKDMPAGSGGALIAELGRHARIG